MPNEEDLAAKLPELEAIPASQVKSPTMPIVVFLQEAEDLEAWSRHDLVQLAVGGVTAEKLDDLLVRTGACRQAQSLWRKEAFAEEDWQLRSPKAFSLRDELLHDFRFAFRNDESLLNKVTQIAEGNTNDDMIQDLNDLATLGKDHTELLTAIGFDVEKLDTAASLSDEMAGLLAEANGVRKSENEARVLRDKAYTHLKELVDEVRNCGKYVFWKNEQRLKGYSSAYWRKRNVQSDSGSEDQENATDK